MNTIFCGYNIHSLHQILERIYVLASLPQEKPDLLLLYLLLDNNFNKSSQDL